MGLIPEAIGLTQSECLSSFVPPAPSTEGRTDVRTGERAIAIWELGEYFFSGRASAVERARSLRLHLRCGPT